MPAQLNEALQRRLHSGLMIPAHPLALTTERTLDEPRQRALTRYYLSAGVGGLAVGVHTTQFAIREPQHGMFQPVLELAAEEIRRFDTANAQHTLRIGGICGPTSQAIREAELLRDLGYHLGLVSLAALPTATDDDLIAHCRAVGEVIPLMGFYLQPAVGGRVLPYDFWRRLLELETLTAIKIAPFNRYQTLDVVRAAVEADRDDVALYTGNDDHIVHDLITPYRILRGENWVKRRIAGGVLGHWAVWTHSVNHYWNRCRNLAVNTVHASGQDFNSLLSLAEQVTDMNAAIFDAANGFRGCIAGIQEVLRRQGLLATNVCLDPQETLSPGQSAEIDRVTNSYPQLIDDEFVQAHLDEWLR